jgi:hypothetical protein
MRSAVLLPFLVTVACAGRQHVELKSAAGPSTDERREAYARLRPKVRQTEVTVWQESQTDRIVAEVSERPILILADKTQVDFPEDLDPVVDEGSVPWTAARRAKNHRLWGSVLGGVAAACMTGGAVTTLSPAFTESSSRTTIGVGLGAIVAGIVVGLFASNQYDREQQQTRIAFDGYDAALRSHLDLCVVPRMGCEASKPKEVTRGKFLRGAPRTGRRTSVGDGS